MRPPFDVLECTRGDYEFGRTCTFTALTNNECSVATGGDATSLHVAILERSLTTASFFSTVVFLSLVAHARHRYDTFDVYCCHVFPLLIWRRFRAGKSFCKLGIKISLAFSRTFFLFRSRIHSLLVFSWVQLLDICFMLCS